LRQAARSGKLGVWKIVNGINGTEYGRGRFNRIRGGPCLPAASWNFMPNGIPATRRFRGFANLVTVRDSGEGDEEICE
jgi:hypothetical protein